MATKKKKKTKVNEATPMELRKRTRKDKIESKMRSDLLKRDLKRKQELSPRFKTKEKELLDEMFKKGGADKTGKPVKPKPKPNKKAKISLIQKDFLREQTLKPRFKTKEKELLDKMFEKEKPKKKRKRTR